MNKRLARATKNNKPKLNVVVPCQLNYFVSCADGFWNRGRLPNPNLSQGTPDWSFSIREEDPIRKPSEIIGEYLEYLVRKGFLVRNAENKYYLGIAQ